MVLEEKKCLQCGVSMDRLGINSFRTGGASGGWHLLFGDLAELGEQKVEFEIWACPHCRRVEFYLPEK